MSTYYLPTHRRSANWYTTRNSPLLAVVVHCTAGLEDLNGGADNSAEATAAYAAGTDRQVSWHSGSDTDSVVYLLPATYTAWHCVGYNSTTYGHEISKRTMDWRGMDPAWVTATLEQTADALRPVLAAHRIPARHASKGDLDRAIAQGGPPVGLVSHSDLDPARRSDPGTTFPWARLLELLGSPPTPKVKTPKASKDDTERVLMRLDTVSKGSKDGDIAGTPVRAVQRLLGFQEADCDGDFGPKTDAAIREFCAKRDAVYPGSVTPEVWYLLCR